jgi:hypothetical protein
MKFNTWVVIASVALSKMAQYCTVALILCSIFIRPLIFNAVAPRSANGEHLKKRQNVVNKCRRWYGKIGPYR